MRDETLALVALGGAVRVNVVDVGKVSLKSCTASARHTTRDRTGQFSILVLGQGDGVVDVEQFLPPRGQVWWIREQAQTLELAVVGHGPFRAMFLHVELRWGLHKCGPVVQMVWLRMGWGCYFDYRGLM